LGKSEEHHLQLGEQQLEEQEWLEEQQLGERQLVDFRWAVIVKVVDY